MIDIMTARKMTEQAKESQRKVKLENHLKEIESAIKMAALEGKNYAFYNKCANEDEMQSLINMMGDLSYKVEQWHRDAFDNEWSVRISW